MQPLPLICLAVCLDSPCPDSFHIAWLVLGSLLLLAVIAFVILGALFVDEAAGNKPDILNRYSPPTSAQPFGAYHVGRSILIRAIYGGQISLAIGILAVAISITLGSLVSLIAGYIGAWVDSLLSRMTEALLSIPPLILLLVLSSALARNSSNITILGREMSSRVVIVVVLIGLTSWMQLSRIARAQVYSLKEREFALAARAIGAGHQHILLRSILPNLVDIADLNVVNMRNIPPTPANCAQRSGRVGRSGLTALIFTDCAARSPHDQHFFKSPARMVAGSVAPPRLDLSNEDPLRSHIHAIWLAETGLSFGKALIEILDIEADEPSLALLPEGKHQIEADPAQQAARERAAIDPRTITELDDPDSLLDQAMQNIVQRFDGACDRWRHMYRSARKQVKV